MGAGQEHQTEAQKHERESLMVVGPKTDIRHQRTHMLARVSTYVSSQRSRTHILELRANDFFLSDGADMADMTAALPSREP